MEVREARPSDKGPLMSFIKDIWGGHDYIPRVWDEWVRDQGAEMFVVLADGRQVGMSRVRFLEDGSAWLEGARVHPDFRGKGLASALGERSMEAAREKGVGIFRLASGSRNKPAHRQIARMGFAEVSRTSVYVPPEGAHRAPKRGTVRAMPGDTSRVLGMIRDSREFELGSEVMWDTFAAYSMTPDVVAGAVRAGSVYTNGDAVAIVRPGSEGREEWRQVCFVGGDPGDAAELAAHLLTRKERRKTDRSFVYVPQGSPVIGELRRAGLKRDFSLILFERTAAKG